MAGVEIRRFSSEQQKWVSGWLAGVLEGALAVVGAGFLLPIVILAGLAVQLTDDLTVIGAIPVIATSIWSAAAFLGLASTRTRRRQLPWAIAAAVVRAAAVGLMAYTAYRTDITDSDRLRSLLIAFAGYSVASGFGSAPTRRVLTKSITGIHRATLFQQRATWGVILAVLAAIVSYRVLDSTDLETPRNFAYLFIAGTAALAAAAFFILNVREPVRIALTPRARLSFSISAATRDQPFRRFLLFRLFLAAAAATDVFLVVYALQELDAPLRFLAIYAGAIAVATALTRPIWQRVADHRGGRAPLQGAALVRFVIPLVILVIPYVQETDFYLDRAEGNDALLWLMAIAFICIGISLAAQIAGNAQYLLEITPRTRGSSYLDTTNLVLAFAGILPIIAGWAIAEYDFRAVFATIAVVSLVSILLSGLLTEVRSSRLRLAQQARPRGVDTRRLAARR